MTFISIVFFLFCAVTVLLYYLVPKKFRWTVLLAASYFYFWCNSHWLILVLFASSVATYLIGLWLQSINMKGKTALQTGTLSREDKKSLKERIKKKGRLALAIGILLDAGVLLFMKYNGFFASNLSMLLKLFGLKTSLTGLHLLLPLGISFYTLQAIAYLVDVYHGKYEADKNLGKFMLFMSFFPQIVQGPIARHDQLAHQLYEGHSFEYRNFTHGLQLVLWGLIKKLIIADCIAIPVSQIFDNPTEYKGMIILFGALLYGIQVYADFSGGMDIARGVSQTLGIELELNFRQPYFARSVEEFWRRWHITLGSWMRDYIFYPLSLSKAFGTLSRKSRKIFGQFVGKRLPAFLAMFIVYFLVGFWHGPEWKYVIYGIWNGVFIMSGILLENVYARVRGFLRIDAESVGWRVFQIIRTFLIISAGRIFSRAASVKMGLSMFKQMGTEWWDLSFIVNGTLEKLGLNTARWCMVTFFVAVLFIVDRLHEKNIPIRDTISKQFIVFRWLIYILAVLAILVFGNYGPLYNAADFIYEQF